MRRADREITEIAETLEVMRGCKVCRLGMYDDGEIYIVPMNFGFTYDNGQLALYFHGATEGRRAEALRRNNRVGFEMDCDHGLVTAQTACGYSFRYASVIGNGIAHFIETTQDKIQALRMIMKHQTGREFEFNERMVNDVAVFRIDAESYSCKRHGI